MSVRRSGGLLLPAVAVVAVLLVAPLLLVGDESLRLFVPGRVGSVHDAPLTLQNYAELLRPAYARDWLQIACQARGVDRAWSTACSGAVLVHHG